VGEISLQKLYRTGAIKREIQHELHRSSQKQTILSLEEQQ
jgi:hypothetical protein